MTRTPAVPAPQTIIIRENRNRHPAGMIRLLYFLFIGWWFGAVYLAVALLLCISIIGLPLGLVMLSRAVDAFFL